MANNTHIPVPTRSAAPRDALAHPFGVPLGDLGWLASLIMGLATGFAAFFLATFVAIVVLLITSSVSHRAVDYALSYRRVGLPVGVFIGVLALAYLGLLWFRRVVRRA